MTSKGGSTPFSVNMEAKVVAVAISKHVSMSMGGSESVSGQASGEVTHAYILV